MGGENLTTILVAALSGGTIAGILRELIAGLVKLREGVKARERDVKNEREETLARAHARTEEALAEVARCREDVTKARALAAETVDVVGRRLDIEIENRRAVEAWAAEIQVIAIGAGLANALPPRPVLVRVD